MRYSPILRLGSLCLLVLLLAFAAPSKFLKQPTILKGAWQAKKGDTVFLLISTDNYLAHTAYLQEGRKFLFTQGGPFQQKQNALQVKWEYDTRQSQNVGAEIQVPYQYNNGKLQLDLAAGTGNKPALAWTELDKGTGPLAGSWQITQRMQQGQLQTIHQTGTRKTVKLLTGNMFQWVAIDPAVKGFYGTGGGAYTFEGGKYTEHIRFFSRDSSRVGASLQFNGKVENGNWHHSGKSSRGEDIYEVWSRGK